jgi:hypothetical protein
MRHKRHVATSTHSGSRADGFLEQIGDTPTGEELRVSVMESVDFVGLRRQYRRLPDDLKENPANPAHLLVMLQPIREELRSLRKEIEGLKKALDFR